MRSMRFLRALDTRVLNLVLVLTLSVAACGPSKADPTTQAAQILAPAPIQAPAQIQAPAPAVASVQAVAPLASPTVAPPEVAKAARVSINPRLLRRFRPIAGVEVASRAPSQEQIDLGRMLWYEPRLSRAGDISCNSCHALDRYGVDGRETSVGHAGRLGRRNAPTVYDTVDHFALFWDGRAKDAKEQAPGPILNPNEMASTRQRVEQTLRGIAEYRRLFAAAFPGARRPITLEHVAIAIAAFERGLVTRSRFDDYLAGEEEALSDLELQGLKLFLDIGCVTCHTGPNVGASVFQKVGALRPWPNQGDLGRFEITKDPADKMMFKVPTLKNITRTAPYFHDGSGATLNDSIALMARHQLDIELLPDEVTAIEAFLGALTGALPEAYIAPPPLPGGDAP